MNIEVRGQSVASAELAMWFVYLIVDHINPISRQLDALTSDQLSTVFKEYLCQDSLPSAVMTDDLREWWLYYYFFKYLVTDDFIHLCLLIFFCNIHLFTLKFS